MHGLRTFILLIFALPGLAWAESALNLKVQPGTPDTVISVLQERISSLMLVAEDQDADIYLFHKSFPDNNRKKPAFISAVPLFQLNAQVDQDCHCAGVPLEPDPAEQLWLASHLMPHLKRVGVLVHRDNEWQKKRFSQAAKLLDVSVRFEFIENQDAISAGLRKLLPKIDGLVLLPDQRLFNPETARLILLSSYRQSVPVIGPDEHFVAAGSLASVYVDDVNMAIRLSDLMHKWRSSYVLPSFRFAQGRVSFNEHVARNYGVPIQSENDIEKALEQRP